MYYNVSQLLKEPVGSTRTYKITEPVPTDDGTTQILPQGHLSLMRTDRGIWVDARLEAWVLVTCSRCLKGFYYPMGLVIEEEYLPTVDINTGQPLHVPEREEGSFTIDQQHGLDLREALRQYTITNQPMKPLCRQDCQGLCPTCGGNRDESPCSCQERAVDPRWGPLAEFLEGNSRRA